MSEDIEKIRQRADELLDEIDALRAKKGAAYAEINRCDDELATKHEERNHLLRDIKAHNREIERQRRRALLDAANIDPNNPHSLMMGAWATLKRLTPHMSAEELALLDALGETMGVRA